MAFLLRALVAGGARGAVAKGIAGRAGAKAVAGQAGKQAVLKGSARQVAAQGAMAGPNAVGARVFARTQAAAPAVQRAAQTAKAAPLPPPPAATMRNAYGAASHALALQGGGRFSQMRAGAQAVTQTPGYQTAQTAYRSLSGGGGPVQQRQPVQPGGITPTEGTYHGTSALYEPGRGWGRGGTTKETGSSFLRGGYKSFTGSEALTGVAMKSDYMPYEFGSGYRSDKSLWSAGRGFRPAGGGMEETAAGDLSKPPDPSTLIKAQQGIGPAKVAGAIGPAPPPIPQPPVPTARPQGAGNAAWKAQQYKYTQPSLFG